MQPCKISFSVLAFPLCFVSLVWFRAHSCDKLLVLFRSFVGATPSFLFLCCFVEVMMMMMMIAIGLLLDSFRIPI